VQRLPGLATLLLTMKYQQKKIYCNRKFSHSYEFQRAPSPRTVHVGSVVDEVALEQGFLRVFPFSPMNIISPMLHSHVSVIWHWRYTISKTDSVVKLNISPFCQRSLRDLTKFLNRLYQVNNNDGLRTCTEFSTICFCFNALMWKLRHRHLSLSCDSSRKQYGGLSVPVTNTRPVSLNTSESNSLSFNPFS
jgi:hypothetical protein